MASLNMTLGKKKEYPSKVTLNLVKRERGKYKLSRFLLLLIIIVVLAATASKFAVIDLLVQVNEANNQVEELQKNLLKIQNYNAEYDDVLLEYSRYSSASAANEVTLIERTLIIAIVEEELLPKATIESYRIEENTLTVLLSGVTLEETAAILNSLNKRPLVDSVSVVTAGTNERNLAQKVSVSMTITLLSGGGEE